MQDIYLREIQPGDDRELATIIRASLMEFGAAKPGTVYFDPTTDHLSELFKTAGSRYFVAMEGEVLLGGAGIFPTEALPGKTCELVKLYLKSSARGKGIGKQLMRACEENAARLGYEHIYLESMPELNIAVPLYEKMGYQYLPAPLGNSGHTGCGIWMLKGIR